MYFTVSKRMLLTLTRAEGNDPKKPPHTEMSEAKLKKKKIPGQ